MIKWGFTKKDGLLFFFAFFAGLFASYFYSASYSLFLDYGHRFDRLPVIYLLSGVSGILLSRILTWVRRNGGFFLANFIFLVVAFAICLEAFRRGEFINQTNGELYSYVTLILAAPLIGITLNILNSLFIKLYNVRESKKLFGKIRSGEVFGSILGYVTVILLQLEDGDSWILFMGGTISLLGSVMVIIFLNKHHLSFNQKQTKKRGKTKAEQGVQRGFLLLLGLSIAVGYFTIFFIDLGFVKGVRGLVSDALSSAQIIAIFFVISKVLDLILSFSSGTIVSLLGIKKSVSLLPFSLILITVLALVVSVVFLFLDLGNMDMLFLIPFFLLALKLVDRILRKSVDQTAFRAFYQVIPKSFRLEKQATIEQGWQLGGYIIAGLVIFGFNEAFPAFNHKELGAEDQLVVYIQFFFVALVAFGIWFLIVNRLVASYRNEMISSLTVGSMKLLNRGGLSLSELQEWEEEPVKVMNLLKAPGRGEGEIWEQQSRPGNKVLKRLKSRLAEFDHNQLKGDLLTALHNSDDTIRQRRLVRFLGNSFRKVEDEMFSLFSHPNIFIQFEAIKVISKRDLGLDRVEETNVRKEEILRKRELLDQKIKHYLDMMTWQLNAMHSFSVSRKYVDGISLTSLLLHYHYEMKAALLNLVGMRYGSSIINSVGQVLSADDYESRLLGIEYLDNQITDQVIKRAVIMLYDDTSVEQKLRMLNMRTTDFIPQSDHASNAYDLMKYNYAVTGLVAKAAVMSYVETHPHEILKEFSLIGIFHHHPVIYLSAAKALNQIDQAHLAKSYIRIEPVKRRIIESVLENKEIRYDPSVEDPNDISLAEMIRRSKINLDQVLSLWKLDFYVKLDQLSQLALCELVELSELKQGVHEPNDTDNTLWVINGRTLVVYEDQTDQIIEQLFWIKTRQVAPKVRSLRLLKDAVCYKFPFPEFLDLIMDTPEVFNKILMTITNQLKLSGFTVD